ncbi:DNA-3-methyladenine glycosylase I [Verrucomicrobia bacterium]|nr:DNA-3-methyladenine glycosylase I [Verrucomicrobiota bacterium]
MIFSEAFGSFDHQVLAQANPETILKTYWHLLSAMRFRKKVSSIVQCAIVLLEISGKYGCFSNYLNIFSIPRRLDSLESIHLFWQGFDRLQADLKGRKMPFFKSTTSLLQLLLDLDYDAVKPDLIVMRLARRIGITEKETGDKAFRSTVRKLQEYAVARKKRVRYVDLQMLAYGGQSNASSLLKVKFCPVQKPCQHFSCPLIYNRLCMDHQNYIEDSCGHSS